MEDSTHLWGPVEPRYEVGSELVVSGVHSAPKVAERDRGVRAVDEDVVGLDVRVEDAAGPQELSPLLRG